MPLMSNLGSCKTIILLEGSHPFLFPPSSTQCFKISKSFPSLYTNQKNVWFWQWSYMCCAGLASCNALCFIGLVNTLVFVINARMLWVLVPPSQTNTPLRINSSLSLSFATMWWSLIFGSVFKFELSIVLVVGRPWMELQIWSYGLAIHTLN